VFRSSFVLKYKKIFAFENLMDIVVFILLVLGGFADYVSLPLVGVAVSLLGVAYVFLRNRQIKIPKYYNLYFLFLVLFLLSNFWSKDTSESYTYYLTFLAGGFFYLYYSNIKSKDVRLRWALILLGLFFGIYFVYLKLIGGYTRLGFTLYWYTSVSKNHNHLGDLWAAALLVPIYNLLQKDKHKFVNMVLILVGSVFLVISQSRSGYISFLAGILTIFYLVGWQKKFKKILVFVFAVFLVAFLVVGSQRTILGSREYWIQSIIGFTQYPWGVGVGNFGIISDYVSARIPELNAYSVAVHNIILEMFSGMGILGGVFAAWFVYVLSYLFKEKSRRNILVKSIFIAIAVNFLFDFTYYIPTMLWLWFISLGIALCDG
jgi:O-antigen ligase